MATKKDEDSLSTGESAPEEKIEHKKQTRIQTAEGWKRSQLKKHKQSKSVSKS